MPTSLQIPRVLQLYSGGQAEVSLKGATLRELLYDASQKYPELYRCICDETGAVRRHLNLFLNNQLIRVRDQLDEPVTPRDVVSLFQAVSGG